MLQRFNDLPTGLGYRFQPRRPRFAGDNPWDRSYDGVYQDIIIDDRLLASASSDGNTYCCGVTFEVWFRSRFFNRSPPNFGVVQDWMRRWFCPTTGHPGAAEVLVSAGLGRRVALEECVPGDVLQFWRRTSGEASGHSALFVSLVGEELTYMSSQRATDGVGLFTETKGRNWKVYAAHPLAS